MLQAAANTEALLNDLYDAVLHPESWPIVCDKLAAVGGGVGAMLIPGRTESRPYGIPHSDSLQDFCEVYLRDGWYLRDERTPCLGLFPSMGVVFEQDFVTRDAMDRSSYYQDFIGSCGLRWFAGIGFMVQGEWWAATIQRSPKQGMFDERDRDRLRQLSSHLSRAGEMAAALGYARAEGVMEAFHRMAVGAVALDHAGSVSMVNASAQRLLGDGLDIVHGRLTALDGGSADRLGGLVSGATVTQAVPRPSGKRPLQLMMCPLGPRSLGEFTRIRAFVVILDPEQRRAPLAEVLAQQFGLTPTEARVARDLASGTPLCEVAGELHLTEGTARTYLKSVLSKTATHKQGELIALLARLATLPGG